VVATPEKRTLQKPLRVLLVEDSENDAMLLLRELRRAGYEVDHERVYTAEEMKEALRTSWEIIISDYRMPRFSAMDALEMANAAGSDAPFIVVSGRIGEDVAVEAMRGGAYDYVMKSNLSRLPQTVERGLEKAEERRQRRKIEEELERRDAILEAVRFAADHFLGEAAGWEESVKAVLRRLGEATEASRVYVCENYTGEDGELWATLRYEWVARGITAQIDYPGLEDVPYKATGFGRWIHTLGRGDLVHGHVRDLPESEQPELQFEDILSIVLVPIFVEGRWWGYIGFDECVEEREWSAAEVGALGAAAGTLGAAIRRRSTEEQLRGSEERYRAVIEQATDGIYLLDVETRRFVETNPSFRTMFGYAPEEIENMEIYDLVAHPREDVDATIGRTLRSGRRIVGERKYRRKDGALLDVEVGVSVISVEGRDVICTIVRDVTERRRNEEALRENEERFKGLAEATFEGIAITRDGKITETNTAFAEMFGYSPQEVIGMTPLDVTAPVSHEVVRRAKALESEEPYEAVLQRKDGSTFDAEIRGRMSLYRGQDVRVTAIRDVSERKEAERRLQKAEFRYRTLVERIPATIYIQTMETVGENAYAVAYMSPQVEEVMGHPPRRFEEDPRFWNTLVHPEDLGRVLAETARTDETGELFDMEYRMLHKDGEYRWIRDKAVLVSDEWGNPSYWQGVFSDVTVRKRTEELLARSEGRLRQIIETEPECVKVLGANGALLEMNPAGLAMIEADSLEQVRGRSVYRYIAPGHREAFIALTEKVLRGGSGTLEFELVGLKGTRRWLETHAVPLRDAGDGGSGLLAITRDVTERKRNEEALRQSEKLYRTVIEQATENIFLVDVETRRIVESNRAFREALGYSEEELHAMTLYDVVAADRESVDANIRRILEQIDPSVGERRYVRKDGSLLHVEVSAGVIVRDGRVTLVGVAHDITERVRAQSMLEERVATLSGIAGELTLERPTESVLGDLARSVVNTSTAIACGVVLIGEQEGAVNLFGSYGFPEGYTDRLSEAYRAGVNSPSLEAYRTRRPVLVRDLRARILADPLYAPVHRYVREAPWDVTYSLPLITRGRALGAIFFCFLPDAEPGEDEKVFLRAVADQAAVAVENARLFSEARGKAALEERQRLARELHDSVSQALYGIALGVETAREVLPDDPERAAEPLEYATTLAEAGMTEMRALIFELRPESLEKEGLVAALEKQAAAVQARHGIRVDAELDREPEVSLEVKEALYRVAQEALHNTVKHARAANVKLKLEVLPEEFTLGISDDGVGFDAQNDFPGHLGLKSMRERATRLGGTLEVASEPGQGVRILARVPR
jgi:PAS domain S-box-containing protein